MAAEILDYARHCMYGALAGLSLKMALYADAPPEDYTPGGEAKGDGYEPGGKRVCLEYEGSYLELEDMCWENSSITASGALIYDTDTGRGVFRSTFKEQTSVRDDFEVCAKDESLIELR